MLPLRVLELLGALAILGSSIFSNARFVFLLLDVLRVSTDLYNFSKSTLLHLPLSYVSQQLLAVLPDLQGHLKPNGVKN
jgi:hypothetical protein